MRNPRRAIRRFLYSALVRLFPPRQTRCDFFESASALPLKTERGNRVFPVSDNAARRHRRAGPVGVKKRAA